MFATPTTCLDKTVDAAATDTEAFNVATIPSRFLPALKTHKQSIQTLLVQLNYDT